MAGSSQFPAVPALLNGESHCPELRCGRNLGGNRKQLNKVVIPPLRIANGGTENHARRSCVHASPPSNDHQLSRRVIRGDSRQRVVRITYVAYNGKLRKGQGWW